MGLNLIQEQNHNECYTYQTSNVASEKYGCYSIEVEITRRCNLNCKHCLRGEPQDITISEKVIDSIFEQVENVTEHIDLTGGEIMLALDMFEYFCNKLIESNWTPQTLLLVTNGTILNGRTRLIEILENVATQKNISCNIAISDDPFHAEQDKENLRLQTYDFFKTELERRNILANGNDDIQVNKIGVSLNYLIPNPTTNQLSLKFSGNAKKLTQQELEKYNCIFRLVNTHVKYYSHRVKIIYDNIFNENLINCCLTFCVNGNVTINNSCEYSSEDKYYMGNILTNDFKSIVDKYNDACMFECYEMRNYFAYKLPFDFVEGISESAKSYLHLQVLRYEKTYDIRCLIKKLFPEASAEAIINKFPIPSEDVWNEILKNMYISGYGFFAATKVWSSEQATAKCVKMLNDKTTDFKNFNLYSADEEKVKVHLLNYLG